MYIDFYLFIFFFLSPALFENPRGDRNYCLALYVEVEGGIPQAVKSTRLRNNGCGLFMQTGELVLQWNGKIGPFPPTSLHEWLFEL